MKKTTKFIIRDREAGNPIDEFSTLAKAEKELEKYEKTDKKDGYYTPNFYEIVEGKNEWLEKQKENKENA